MGLLYSLSLKSFTVHRQHKTDHVAEVFSNCITLLRQQPPKRQILEILHHLRHRFTVGL